MNKHTAIYKLYKNVTHIHGDIAYDKDNNEVAYDENAVQIEIDNNAYKERRASEYKTIAEQLDMLYWDKVNNTNLWQEHINAVKTKYPKG